MYEALKGRLAALKNNRLFEFAVITVIIISALEIGAKTYELPNLVNTMLVGLDWFITVFVVEITIVSSPIAIKSTLKMAGTCSIRW